MSVTLCAAIVAIVAFFICGIPFGLLISARMAGIDVRKSGSGNIGMTNVARTAGGKAAALTFACDVGKGLICMLAGKAILSALCHIDPATLAVGGEYDWCSALFFMACVFGHVFSPSLGFHGVKGISVGLGSGIGLFPPIGLGAFAVFLVLAIPTKLISLGSIAAAAAIPILSAVFGMSAKGLAFTVAVAIVVIWSHRENIKRLLNGTESKFAIKH